jgi:1-deoxy-D-xylulose-5-phosphate synthase
VLDRAGITGDDGASHNGMWDLALLGIVPGLHLAAPRDEATLREMLRVAATISDAPSVIRFPKTPLPDEVPAIRRIGGIDVLAEPDSGDVDVLLVSVGAMATDATAAAQRVSRAGYRVRVVDLCWVTPLPTALVDIAAQAKVVVTVEDGVVVNGVGSRVSQRLREAGSVVATRELGIPLEFLEHGKVADVRANVGLTPQGISRRVVEFAAGVLGQSESASQVVPEQPELPELPASAEQRHD